MPYFRRREKFEVVSLIYHECLSRNNSSDLIIHGYKNCDNDVKISCHVHLLPFYAGMISHGMFTYIFVENQRYEHYFYMIE